MVFVCLVFLAVFLYTWSNEVERLKPLTSIDVLQLHSIIGNALGLNMHEPVVA